MSFIDHVQCSNCGARIEPESLSVRQGQPYCPQCGGALKLKDLFGVADAFTEEDAPHVTIDDLVPGGSPPASSPAAGPAARPDRSRREEDAQALPGPGASALDVLRSMKG